MHLLQTSRLQPHIKGIKRICCLGWRVLEKNYRRCGTYAIIETGGKQLKVEAGDAIFVEKLEVEAGEKVTFDKVLLVGDETVTIGAPYVEGATVEATVEKQGKERKVTIYKYNAKKHYHKKQGHRQPYTKLIVDSINVK